MRVKIINYLIDKYKIIKEDILNTDIKYHKNILKENKSLKGSSLLFITICNGNLEFIKYILEKFNNINKNDIIIPKVGDGKICLELLYIYIYKMMSSIFLK